MFAVRASSQTIPKTDLLTKKRLDPMNTITIPEDEYRQMQQLIADLQRSLNQYAVPTGNQSTGAVSIKRGSGRDAIAFIADDFTAPLPDFEEYT